jgi:hypothetical protein
MMVAISRGKPFGGTFLPHIGFAYLILRHSTAFQRTSSLLSTPRVTTRQDLRNKRRILTLRFLPAEGLARRHSFPQIYSRQSTKMGTSPAA